MAPRPSGWTDHERARLQQRGDSGIPSPLLAALALLAVGGGLYSGWKEYAAPTQGLQHSEQEPYAPVFGPEFEGVSPELEQPPTGALSAPPAYAWQAPGAVLAGEDLRGRSFARCALPDADLRGANLDGVRFHECDLRGADFRGASLGGTFMLDSCRLDGAQFDEQQLSVLARGSFRLRGSTVGGDDPQTQARELSRLLLSHGRDIDARVRGLRSLLAGELGSAGGLGLPAPDELLRSDEDTPGDD